MRRALLMVAGLIVAATAVGGCGGYRVGALLPEHIKTIAVPVFVNETGEPNLEIPATNAVINQLTTDGTLRVVPEEEADVVLTVRLIRYQRKPIRYTGVTRPTEYRITVTVLATLHDRHQGVDLWKDDRLSGNAEFVVGAGLPASERRARPVALEDLAHDVVEHIVEGGW
jgi:outer membrane lipopolysaccharide assembly protein LptE/RlpB